MNRVANNILQQMETIGAVAHELLIKNQQRFSGQQQVINLLAKEEGLTQSTLAELLDIRPSSLAELLQKLEKTGVIEKKAAEHDKRIKRVYLTKIGRKRVVESTTLPEELSSQFVAGLTIEEQATMEALLKKLMSHWPDSWAEYTQKSYHPVERLEQLQQIRQMIAELDAEEFEALEQEEASLVFQQRFQHFNVEDPFWKRQLEESIRRRRQENQQESVRLKPFQPTSAREKEWSDF